MSSKCNLEWVWKMPTEERANSESSDNASDEDAEFEVVGISDTAKYNSDLKLNVLLLYNTY